MAAKSQKAKIVYLDEAGQEVDIDSGKVSVIQFRFTDGVGNLDLFMEQVPDEIRVTASIRGLAEKIRDEYAGADSPEMAHDDGKGGGAKGMVERLLGGEWYGQREGGGPSISTFVQAVKETKLERFGSHPEEFPNGYSPEADGPALMEKYVGKGKAEIRKKTLAGNSRLNAIYTKLVAELAAAKAQRATDKATKAAAAAAEAAPTGNASAL